MNNIYKKGDLARWIFFFCCFGALWGFSADFSATLEEIRKKHEKGAIWGDFRHYTNKLFSFGDWQTKKADFLENKARYTAEWRVLGLFGGFSWAIGRIIRWSKKNADLNGLRSRVGDIVADFGSSGSFSQ